MLARIHFLGRIALLSTGIWVSSREPPGFAITENMAKEPDYGVWDRVLKGHVKSTVIRGIPLNAVDYDGIRSDPDFTLFVESLKTAPTSGAGKAAEYALWINAYNALAIKMVIDHPCRKQFWRLKESKISSIKDIGTIVKPVWKQPAGIVGGQTLALDDIENVKLRNPEGYPADPLLHACIVCASASCPDVSLTAYKPETLEADMAANMRHFLANTKKGLALDKEGGVITLSKVFQWFGGDFIKAGHGSVIDALLPYMPEDAREYVAHNKASLKTAYFDYDWGLNGQSRGAPGKRGSC